MQQSIVVITCQPDPDYIRAVVLRAGVSALPNLKVTIVKNDCIGILRYAEVAYKILKCRFLNNPDVYLLTFRGYEILPWVLFVAAGKRVVFDEFINAFEWAVYEHKILSRNGIFASLVNACYGLLLRRCDVILSDTEAHANISSELSVVPRERYLSVPVGADESLFFPLKSKADSLFFRVFFYGNILPLHGLDTMLEAALQLRGESSILFTFVGGKTEHRNAIEHAISCGARITYSAYIPFADLPDYVHNASLCLGGPFGDTFQSQFVVTGKTYQFIAAGAPTLIGANRASGLFRDKENCLIVPQGDSHALATAIAWAQQHPAALAAIGAAGRMLYESAFSNKIITNRMATLFRQAGETSCQHE